MEQLQVGLLSKSGSAYEHLRRLATRGLLRPDRRLSPPDVASELRISVTPVRDALARLAAEGFIRGADGRGYFTKPYTVEEQRDLKQLLGVSLISSLLSAPAAGAASLSALAKLEAADSEQAEGEAGPTFACALADLAMTAATASGNLILPPLVRNALERTHHIRQLDFEAADQRRAEIGLLRDLVGHACQANLERMMDAYRRRIRRIDARLPGLVAQANEAAARLKFP